MNPMQPATLEAEPCYKTKRITDVEIDFVHDAIPKLQADVNVCIYRIAQEAIQNATKHSQCRQINVTLTASADGVRLSIVDAGRGFDPGAAEHSSGLGLVSMAERARSVGGQLTLRSAVGQGTCVEVSIPSPAEAS